MLLLCAFGLLRSALAAPALTLDMDTNTESELAGVEMEVSVEVDNTGDTIGYGPIIEIGTWLDLQA